MALRPDLDPALPQSPVRGVADGMNGLVSFVVRGLPAPQGSKRHVGKGIMVESSKRVKPWRENVAREAAAAWGGRPLHAGPVAVEYVFIASRPARLRLKPPKNPKRAGPPKPREWPTSRQVGDLEKLIRAVNDALTGVVLVDDSQIVEFTRSIKVYDYDEPPGVRVVVMEAGDA